MANLFTLTAPLMLRTPNGEKRVIAELFEHPEGLLYFDLYWHLGQPADTMHILRGELHGDGPWKIQDHVINVLGCHGTDAELAQQHAAWNAYRQRADSNYPPAELRAAIARRLVQDDQTRRSSANSPGNSPGNTQTRRR